MKIAIEMHGDVAVFRYPPSYPDVVNEFDRLLEKRNMGALDAERYFDALQDLFAHNPWFINGHAHLGNALHDRRDFERALLRTSLVFR